VEEGPVGRWLWMAESQRVRREGCTGVLKEHEWLRDRVEARPTSPHLGGRVKQGVAGYIKQKNSSPLADPLITRET